MELSAAMMNGTGHVVLVAKKEALSSARNMILIFIHVLFSFYSPMHRDNSCMYSGI